MFLLKNGCTSGADGREPSLTDSNSRCTTPKMLGDTVLRLDGRVNVLPKDRRKCCLSVARKNERGRLGRWNCHDCHSSFNALSGTIMSQTRIPLQKWFLAIAIIVNAKKSVSSPQLARDLDLTQQTALYLQQRIWAQMADRSGAGLLSGIVEADETYVGGKPR